MRLKELGERRVISWIRRTFGRPRTDILLGIGDDAAVVRVPKSLLLTTDILVEDEDFRRAVHPPRLLGRKALNVNLSDIAAMGGRPLHALVGMAMPGDVEERWLRLFMAGFRSAAREAGVALVGGDLSRAEKIMISVTVTGEAKSPVTRSGARPGDWVFVSGTLGDAAQGFQLLETGRLQGEKRGAGPLIRAFLDPAPRLELGELLARKKLASAMIDISDGMSVDLAHVCAESRVGAEIEASLIPLSAALKRFAKDPLDMALDGGEDFELLFTVRPAKLASVVAMASEFKLKRIGRITAGKTIFLVTPDKKKKPLRAGGFEHFS
jgi:thiamine-monophosphate kinase